MFVLTIRTDNAAFADDPSGECARILREAVRNLDSVGFDAEPVKLRDVNGNTVGSYGHNNAGDRILAEASGCADRHLLESLRHRLRQHDDKLNDTANDGRKAVPPDGDDYNELYSEVMLVLDRILEG